eukprot:46363-Eustigmatos_ZCMA.PRE.1
MVVLAQRSRRRSLKPTDTRSVFGSGMLRTKSVRRCRRCVSAPHSIGALAEGVLSPARGLCSAGAY